MEKLWQTYNKLAKFHNFKKDPDALEIVFHIGYPYWLSKIYSSIQKRALIRLLKSLNKVGKNEVLEIGCGGGRWIKELIRREYNVTGIDLQKNLIEYLKKRFPKGEFYNVSIFNFETTKKFDLILSVTVLQHIPYNKQIQVIRKIRSLCKKSGSVIIIENIKDKATHVFSNSIKEWTEKFEKNGFRVQKIIPTLFLPVTLKYKHLKKIILTMFKKKQSEDIYEIIEKKTKNGKFKRLLKNIEFSFKWGIGIFDYTIEEILLKEDVLIQPSHCGFLFEAI